MSAFQLPALRLPSSGPPEQQAFNRAVLQYIQQREGQQGAADERVLVRRDLADLGLTQRNLQAIQALEATGLTGGKASDAIVAQLAQAIAASAVFQALVRAAAASPAVLDQHINDLLSKSISEEAEERAASDQRIAQSLSEESTARNKAISELARTLATGGSALGQATAAAVANAVMGPAGATDLNVPLFDGATGKLIKDSGKAFTPTGIGLGNVTNDAQTKSAIVPNTAPSAGQLLVGNAGGTAYAPVSPSGDVTVSSAGVFSIGASKVTYAMMQNASAASVLLGRGTAGTSAYREITLGTGLSFTGDVLNNTAAGMVLLADVTLGSAGTSLDTGAFAAYKNLAVHIYVPAMAGSDTPSLWFNSSGAGTTAYRYKWTFQAAAATAWTAGNTAISTDRIKIGASDSARTRRAVAYIGNDGSVTEKEVAWTSATGTVSAATQGQVDMGNGAWISAAATQITSIQLVSTSNMNTGTRMVVFGW